MKTLSYLAVAIFVPVIVTACIPQQQGSTPTPITQIAVFETGMSVPSVIHLPSATPLPRPTVKATAHPTTIVEPPDPTAAPPPTELPLLSDFLSLSPTITSPVSLVGDFEIMNALEAFYGPSVVIFDKDRQDFSDGAIDILLAAPFTENGTQKHVLFISKPFGGDCHSCGAGIAGVIFAKSEGKWEIEASNFVLDSIGSFGIAPKGQLLKIGPDKYGVAFLDTFYSSASDETCLLIYTNVNGEIERILNVPLALRTYPLDPNYVPPPLPDYTSRIHFVQGNNRDYNDMLLIITEPRYDSSGSFTGATERTQLFVFDGAQYQPNK